MLCAGGYGRSQGRDGPCPGLVIEVPAVGGWWSSRSCSPGCGFFSCTGPKQEEDYGSKDQEGNDSGDNSRQEIRSGNNKVDDGSTPSGFSA
jgi:hypothetical protein